MSSIYPTGRLHSPMALLFLAGAVIALATAWGFQLIGGYIPCKLCLQQRESYYFAIPLVLIALIGLYQNWNAIPIRLLLGIAGLAMLFGAATGVYQAGAEWEWWLGPNDCGDAGMATDSVGDLFTQLKTSKLITCGQASWRLFGLSFAGWNAVISGGLACLALFASIAPAYGSSSTSQ